MHQKYLVTIVTALVFATAVNAEETQNITYAQLPKAVQSAALKHLDRSSITKVEAIQEEGSVKYEIESTHNGIGKDITFASDGSILEIEQAVKFKELPAAVQNTIKKRYPKLDITELESVQTFFFNVEGTQAGKSVEFKVLASGKMVDENDEEDEGNDRENERNENHENHHGHCDD